GQPGRPRPRAARHRARLGAQARRAGAAGRGADQGGQRRRRPRPGPRRREAGLRRRLRQRGRQGGHLGVPREAEADVAGSVGTDVERLAQLLRDASSVVALTGAGISVPSGIPDFRSPGTGLWENVDPMEVAHLDVFLNDPGRFWSYYRPRFGMLSGKVPNPAHRALAQLEERGMLEAVITQNIDTLHRKAGSRNVVEVHGTIETGSCWTCKTSYPLAEIE